MAANCVVVEIAAPATAIFDLIHDYQRRLEWDPFLREARLLDQATQAGTGIRARCVARFAIGPMAMETIYISFTRPRVAAVKMLRGPAILKTFAATLRHETTEAGSTRVIYHYSFTARPRFLAFLLEPTIQWIFERETRRRLGALKRYFEAPGGADGASVARVANAGPTRSLAPLKRFTGLSDRLSGAIARTSTQQRKD